MAAVEEVWQNGYSERLMRTIREEVDLLEYRTLQKLTNRQGRFWGEVYSKKEIHSSLGYLALSEYEAA
jgi:putative transposase